LSAPYKLAKTDQGSYLFTSDTGLEYTCFFIACLITDNDGNDHSIYSFGFDRSGKFMSTRYANRFDERIKVTIIYIIREFFRVNGDNVLLYFCYPDDEFARHRSIAFRKWYNEELSDDIDHFKKDSAYKDEMLYGGMLILKKNPFHKLLNDAIDVYIAEMNDKK
jgi:hypothetical protein